MFNRVTRAAVLCLALCSAVSAQSDTATITGRVADPSDASVVGAQVVVVNTATNLESVATTNSEGVYRVQSLRPGTYRITVSQPGFRRLLREGVEVRGGDTVGVNLAMEIGSVTETVEVKTSTPLLETETSSTGTVLKGDFFAALPVYQRDPKNAMYFTPGVQLGGNGYAGRLENFHIAGLRDTAIGLFEDGMLGTSAEGDVGGNSRGIDTIMNSVEEIKVLSTSLPAEYGHSAGGAITIVKKGGTNTLHGQASILGRSRSMQHRKFFDAYRLSQIQPGTTSASTLFVLEPDFNLNGPVYIPKLYDGRNKTFFMFGYQKFIEKQGRQTFYTVPTEAMLNGDLSFGGIGQQIYDPRSTRQLANGSWTRDPFPGNTIPQSAIDPVARRILQLNPWARPNVPGTVTSTGVSNNLLMTSLKVVPWDYYTFRGDHQFNPNFKTYATWTYNNKWERTPNPNITSDAFDASLVYAITRQDTGSLGSTWVISPTLINDTRFGFSRQAAPTASPFLGANAAGMLGIPNLGPETFPQNVVPNITNPGAGNQATNESLLLRTDFTNMRGKHAFKTGYEVMRFRNNEYSPGSPSGSFTYASTAGLTGSGTQTIANTGNGFAGFLVGAISSANASLPLISWLPRSTMHSFYVQDDWKILPTLTLNIGVRYQTEDPLHTKYDQISNFDPTQPDNVVPGGMGLITHPKGGLNKRDWNNFQPRFGMAWNPLKKVVVRGGFALSTQDLKLFVDQRAEYSNTANLSQVAGDPRPLFQLSAFPGFASFYPQLRPDGTSPFLGNNFADRGVTWVDPNLRNPYTMTWNLGVQYELASNYLVDASYQGSAGVGLTLNKDYNGRSYEWAQNLRRENPAEFTRMVGNSQLFRPFPNYGGITFRTNMGHSTFHSGTIKLEKRYSRGLTLLGFYTFSKSIDNETGGSYWLDDSLNKGRSGFDQTHRFSTNLSYEIPFGRGRKWMSGGGWKNAVLGGWNYVTAYQWASGNPVTFGFGDSPFQYLPGMVAQIGGRANLTKRPELRDNWQDLGNDRFTVANQNNMWTPESITYMSYPEAYTMGNGGRNVVDRQRQIAMSMAISKQIQIKENLRFQTRLDYQNPLKWYNWGNAPNATYTANATNAMRNFGKPGLGSEGTTNNGGTPMMNLTLAFIW